MVKIYQYCVNIVHKSEVSGKFPENVDDHNFGGTKMAERWKKGVKMCSFEYLFN